MEIWKTIQYEDRYEVSSLGRIRNIQTQHIKSIRYDRDGYPRVTLYPSGKTYTIHRLIMTTFHERKEWLEHVNHINHDRGNSILSNLEWVSAKENVRHMHSHGRNADINGSRNPMAKLTQSDVIVIRYSLYPYSDAAIARMYNVASETIRRVRTFSTWRHAPVNNSC